MTFFSLSFSLSFFYFCRKWQADLKIHVKIQKTQNSQNNFEKIEFGGPIITHCKTYYKAMVVKSVWYWHKDRYID